MPYLVFPSRRVNIKEKKIQKDSFREKDEWKGFFFPLQLLSLLST